MDKKIHEGRNVKRFRELLGIKQDALATKLGDDWNQKKISLLEQKEEIEHDLLTQIAGALMVPVAAIKNFDEERAVNIVTNNFSDNTFNDDVRNNCSSGGEDFLNDYDPEDKWIEAMREQRKLVEEIQRLHEQIIKEKEDKMELYERLLAEMKNRV